MSLVGVAPGSYPEPFPPVLPSASSWLPLEHETDDKQRPHSAIAKPKTDQVRNMSGTVALVPDLVGRNHAHVAASPRSQAGVLVSVEICRTPFAERRPPFAVRANTRTVVVAHS